MFAGVALFATVEVTVKDAHAQGSVIPAFQFVALRFFTAGLVFLGLLLFRRGPGPLIPARGDLWKTVILGVVAAPLAIGLFHRALAFKALKASTGAAIFSVNPIFVAVLAPVFLKERISAREWIGLILGFAGAFFMSYSGGEGGSELLAGGAVMAASAFFFALNVVLAKPLIRKYGGLVFNAWAFLAGGVIAALLGLVFEDVDFAAVFTGWRGSLDIAWVVLVGTAVAYYCYLVGLSRVNVSRGSYFFFAKPFLALICSLLYLSETVFSGREWIGFFLIMSGLGLILFGRGSRRKTSRRDTENTEEVDKGEPGTLEKPIS